MSRPPPRSDGTGTYALLKKRPHEVVCKGDPLIHPEFVAKLRESDSATGLTKVVSGLEISVLPGEKLWTMGNGPGSDDPMIGCLHWELFCETSLMDSWVSHEDPNDNNVAVDGVDQIVQRMEGSVESEADRRCLSENEVRAYYNQGAGAELRLMKFRFPNEWSVDPGAFEQAMTSLGVDDPHGAAEALKPYLWWNFAASVLPSSSKVWHYNPISFLYEYARATGSYNANLTVLVTRRGQPVVGVYVEVLSGGQSLRRFVTERAGTCTFYGLTPGSYEVKAADEQTEALDEVELVPAMEFTQPLELPAPP